MALAPPAWARLASDPPPLAADLEEEEADPLELAPSADAFGAALALAPHRSGAMLAAAREEAKLLGACDARAKNMRDVTNRCESCCASDHAMAPE